MFHQFLFKQSFGMMRLPKTFPGLNSFMASGRWSDLSCGLCRSWDEKLLSLGWTTENGMKSTEDAKLPSGKLT